MKEKLEKYANDEIKYIPLYYWTNKHRELFPILGKYAYKEIFKRKIPKCFGVNEKTYLKYFALSSIILTHYEYILDRLKENFGEPLYHNKFGEGFKGGYNEETNEYDEPEIKESFISYFVTIENVDCHIGYDERGLKVEIKEKTRYEYIISAMKKFIELCYKDRADLNK